jgi:hypothetical protein
MGGPIQDWTDNGILITAEGVHPSAKLSAGAQGEDRDGQRQGRPV